MTHKSAAERTLSQKILGDLWRDIQRSAQQREAEEARKDPVKHRLSRVIQGGLRYTYFPAGADGRGVQVRFCYSKRRNVAGYFLIWREREARKTVRRDQWDATTSKASAIRCARRMADEFKAKREAERRAKAVPVQEAIKQLAREGL